MGLSLTSYLFRSTWYEGKHDSSTWLINFISHLKFQSPGYLEKGWQLHYTKYFYALFFYMIIPQLFDRCLLAFNEAWIALLRYSNVTFSWKTELYPTKVHGLFIVTKLKICKKFWSFDQSDTTFSFLSQTVFFNLPFFLLLLISPLISPLSLWL